MGVLGLLVWLVGGWVVGWFDWFDRLFDWMVG